MVSENSGSELVWTHHLTNEKSLPKFLLIAQPLIVIINMCPFGPLA